MIIKYTVYLDNKLVGKIKNGGNLKFDTTEGSHELVLKVLWMKSQTIKFKKDKNDIHFTCGSNITGFKNLTYAFWPTVNNDNYIFLEKDNKTLERNS